MAELAETAQPARIESYPGLGRCLETRKRRAVNKSPGAGGIDAQRVAKIGSRARGRPPALADPERAAIWPAIRAAVACGELRTNEAARLLGVSPTWISRRVRAGDTLEA